jgi:hypothetical protein
VVIASLTTHKALEWKMHATAIEQVQVRITTTDGNQIFYRDWVNGDLPGFIEGR